MSAGLAGVLVALASGPDHTVPISLAAALLLALAQQGLP